jgi:outer membrane protein TolC
MNKSILCMSALLFLVAFALPGKAEEPSSSRPVPTVWTAEDAVRFALRNSPDSLIAQKRIDSAAAMVIGARSSFSPEIGLSSEYSQTTNPMYSFGNILNQGQFNNNIDFNDPGRTDDLNFKIQAQYRLYNGGRDRAALDAALAGQKGSAANLTVVHHQLSFEVVRLFLTIAQDQETVSARESALEAIRASLAVAKARFEEGTLLKADLLGLEAQEAGASEDLIQARHTLELSKRAFLTLLGLRTGEVAIDLKKSADQDPPERLDFTGRPELQALDTAIDAAEAGVRKAEGGRLPTMDGFASYQVDKGTVLDGSGDSWMAGVRVNYSLFDGDRTTAGITEARARLAELQELRHKTELALNLEMQRADLEYQQADQRLIVTEKMVTVAKESARLNRIRFQEGVVLSTELIDGEKRLTDALVRQSAAKTLRGMAIANLRRTVGMPQFDQITAEPQERK